MHCRLSKLICQFIDIASFDNASSIDEPGLWARTFNSFTKTAFLNKAQGKEICRTCGFPCRQDDILQLRGLGSIHSQDNLRPETSSLNSVTSSPMWFHPGWSVFGKGCASEEIVCIPAKDRNEKFHPLDIDNPNEVPCCPRDNIGPPVECRQQTRPIFILASCNRKCDCFNTRHITVAGT